MDSVADIHTIKWLLVGVLAAVIVIALAAVATFWVFVLMYKISKEQNEGKAFQVLAEEHLARGEIDGLLASAEERLTLYPNDAWAHWYKAQAAFRKGAYPESRRSFQRVLELEPGWHSSVNAWIELVEEKIQEGPHLVD